MAEPTAIYVDPRAILRREFDKLFGEKPTRWPSRPALGPQDTLVRLSEYDVFANKDLPIGPEHAYVEIYDPRTGRTYIVRGGPNARSFPEAAAKLAQGRLSLIGAVKPQTISEDGPGMDAKQRKPIAQAVLKGRPADQVVKQAERFVVRALASPPSYRPTQNSNSVAFGAYQDLTGVRPRSAWNWGQGRRLPTRPSQIPPIYAGSFY